jgi:hypothetical protein
LSPAEVLRQQNLALLRAANSAAVASAGLSDYELKRQANMATNHAMLVKLRPKLQRDRPSGWERPHTPKQRQTHGLVRTTTEACLLFFKKLFYLSRVYFVVLFCFSYFALLVFSL